MKKILLGAMILAAAFAACNKEEKAAEPKKSAAEQAKEDDAHRSIAKKMLVEDLKQKVVQHVITERTANVSEAERAKAIMEIISRAEQMLASPGNEEIEGELLIILGKTKSVDVFGDEFYEKRKEEYAFEPKLQKYFYKGAEFKKVLEKYGDTPMGEVAAYYLTGLPSPKECEKGDLHCNMSEAILKSELLFSKYSQTEAARKRATLLNASLHQLHAAQKEITFDKKTLPQFVETLRKYEEMARGLKPETYADVLATLGNTGVLIKDKKLARDMFGAFIEKYPEDERAEFVKEQLKKLK